MSGGFDHGDDAQPARSPLVRLSTDDLAGPDRLAIWHEVYGRYMFNLDIEPLGDEPFRAEMALRALPGANVLLGSRSASRTSITRPLLQTASDTVVLAVLVRGRAQATQLGREATIPLNGAILMSSSELASHTLADDGRLLSIQLPTATLAPYVADLGAAFMRPFTPEVDALRLLVDYAGGALALGATASTELQAMVALHLRDMVARLVGASRGAEEAIASRGLRAARVREVRKQVVARLNEHDLSAESVGSSLRISASYVRKLLRLEGSSFAEYVHGLRLEQAAAMLRDRRLADRTIAWIAFETGFNDVSYFNRSFRRRFARTPSEARNEQPGR
ncbi:MAG: AraC family transcriptional regulator [Janthinobacterium lividum]